MIAPPPCSFMMRAAAWEQTNTALTLMSMILENSSTVYSYRLVREDTPALFARMSRLPKRAFTDAKASATSCGSQRFGQMPITRPSYSVSCASALSTESCREPQMATFAPLSRNFFAMAKPMPRVPPVTTAVFPFNIVRSSFIVPRSSPNTVLLSWIPPRASPCSPGSSPQTAGCRRRSQTRCPQPAPVRPDWACI